MTSTDKIEHDKMRSDKIQRCRPQRSRKLGEHSIKREKLNNGMRGTGIKRTPYLLIRSTLLGVAVGVVGARGCVHGEELRVRSHPPWLPEGPGRGEDAAAGGYDGLGGAGHRGLCADAVKQKSLTAAALLLSRWPRCIWENLGVGFCGQLRVGLRRPRGVIFSTEK